MTPFTVKQYKECMEGEGYLTVSQLAKKLGYSRSKIYGWINRSHNPCPAYNPGERETRIPIHKFDIWFEQFAVQRCEKLIDIEGDT